MRAGLAAGESGDDVGEHERAERDDRDREQRDTRLGYDVQLVREEVPQRPAGNDAERHADDDADADRDRRLPRDRRGELAAGEAERLEQREIAAAAPNRCHERERERGDGAGRERARRAARASSPSIGS